MNAIAKVRRLIPGQLAAIILALALAFAVPAFAQSAQSSSTQPQSSPPQTPAPTASSNTDHEGFWGRVNPFARKKWVNKRIDPLKDRLTELDEVNAKNTKDIQDVDTRAQAGIQKAQSTADTANQTATAAGDQAQKADTTAQAASTHVNQLGETVNGLDQYRPKSEADVAFKGGQPILSAEARKQLDDMAAGLAGRQGYIVEIEGHAPGAGSIGIQHSERLTEAVKRYLVEEHQIPVYRLHAVALGNVQNAAAGDDSKKPVRQSSVHIRLMENSLAAQGDASPHSAASLTGAERP